MPSKPGKEREIWLDEFKKKMKCSRCGYDRYPGAIHFHHINPDEKDKGVGALKRYPTWKLIEEIYKCVILCANCHAEIHSDSF